MNACPLCLLNVDRYGCGVVRFTERNWRTKQIETEARWTCYAPGFPRRRSEADRFAEGLSDLVKLVRK